MSRIALKILRFFLAQPYKEVYLRDIARRLNISPFSAKKHLDLLVKKKLILDNYHANTRNFRANMESRTFRQLKIASSVHAIESSGLIESIRKTVSTVSAIILYGSTAKGEDEAKSDLDLLVIGARDQLSTAPFQKALGRDINVQVMSWAQWNKQKRENSAFYYEVIAHGLPLMGELPIVR